MLKKFLIPFLVALTMSIVTLLCNTILDVNSLKANMGSLSDKTLYHDNELKTIKKMITDIHWFLIQRNNVKVPKK